MSLIESGVVLCGARSVARPAINKYREPCLTASTRPHASLVSLLTYVVSSDETYDGTGDLGFSIYDQICNLRRQAHSAAQQVRMLCPHTCRLSACVKKI